MKPSDICETWKALTCQGNTHFHNQVYMQALACYEQARSLLLQHFEDWDTPDNAVAALVVSYLNLADTQQRLGRSDEAADTLCMAHERLVMCSRHPAAEPALREAACRHQRETFAALTRFANEQDHHSRVCPLVKACLVRTQPHMQMALEATSPASHLH
ncbi:MAG: tetratricopeptide repeat protein [Methylophilus sp.]|nr:tetratricopeptide repeat protein [Methylophilus sp.]